MTRVAMLQLNVGLMRPLSQPVALLRGELGQVELVYQSAQFSNRRGSDLSHRVTAMNFHGCFCNAHLAGDLFVQAACGDLNQDGTLSRREYFEARSEGEQCCLILPAFAVFREPDVYSVE